MRPDTVCIEAGQIKTWYTFGIDSSEEIDILAVAREVEPYVLEAHIEQEVTDNGFHVSLRLCLIQSKLETCLNTVKKYLGDLRLET